MRIKWLFVLLYSLYISNAAHSQLNKIYLNPKSVAREKQSKYIDSVRFIPLEVKDGIQSGTYFYIQLTEKYILVIDQANKKLFFYSKDGRFVKSINYNKLGANFSSYQERSNQVTFFGPNKNYALTSKDAIKIQLDWSNPRNTKYFKKYIIDLSDPSFTIKKVAPDNKDITQVYHYYDDYFMQGQVTASPLYKDSLDHELKVYKNNKLAKSYFPYNHINEPRFLYTQQNVTFSKTDTPYINLITRPFCDTIYRMVKDSLFPAYHLVLPLENSLPSSFFTRPFKNKTERDNFYRNNGWMLNQVYWFYEMPKFIFFSVSYFSNYESYIYERQTGLIYKTKNIRADSSHYNLPLLADLSITRKGDKMYKTQKAGDLAAYFEKNKNVPVPKELEEFLKSKPPSTTPVIVEFKLKTNL